MKKDPRLSKVVFEEEPYTPASWDEHVGALAEVIDEIQMEQSHGRDAQLRRGADGHGRTCGSDTKEG